jgi:histone arginine demethylase JMJD6
MGWRKKMQKARKLHRPSLKDWECDGLYDKFPQFVESLQHEKNKEFPVILDAQTLTPQQFWDEYEAKCIPCIIRNIPNGYGDGPSSSSSAMSEWPAVQKWTFDALEKSPLRERPFKCGEDDDGNSVKIKLKYFLRYLQHNRDDSPLYVFDSAFERDKIAKEMLQDYQVPIYFRDDLFRLVSESRRPPYRWVLFGPERSGSTVHVDPLATNAWNTLLHGQKRWVLFPPHVPKYIVKGKDVIRKGEDDEASHYFMYILPRIQQNLAFNTSEWTCYEFTQQPGETVFVPNGWWHAVLNLTHTVGVTQNYCSPRNFEAVWKKTRTGRPKLAWKWLGQLGNHFPHLANRARQINAQDQFRMKYDPNHHNKMKNQNNCRSKGDEPKQTINNTNANKKVTTKTEPDHRHSKLQRVM